MKTPFRVALLCALLCRAALQAQTPVMSAGPAVDNLVHAPGTDCSNWGELTFQKTGTGKKTLLLLPGWGFGGAVFDEFIQKNRRKYTMYVVTLPGYGGTKPYPMPPPGSSYGETYWLNGVEAGLLALVKKEKMKRPVLVAHFAVSTHLALDLAAKHPDRFEKVVVIGGPALFRFPPPYDTLNLAGRVRAVDASLAPRWFKTVSRDTWLKGNFPPGLYALDTLLGQRLFEQANEAPLPVQIRYLCECWASDFSVYEKIGIPVLVLVPSLPRDLLDDPKNGYTRWFTDDWTALAAKNSQIRLEKIEGSGCNVMNEKPGDLGRLLDDFLGK